MTDLRMATTLENSQAGAMLALADTAKAHDGSDALSEQTRLWIEHGAAEDVRYYLLTGPDGLLGFAVAAQTAELVVAPDQRGRGLGGRLLDAVLQDRPGIGVWVHGRHPAARALARRHQLRCVRDLRVLRLRLWDDDGPVALAEPRLPGGPQATLSLRTFRPGLDEEGVLAVNRRAFRDHPEQGALGLDDLRQREAEPWFDPAGFFLAVDTDSDAVAGFHWTKVHQDGAGLAEKPVGEVYVVGVAPEWQGSGLGRALTLHGVRYLRDLGLPWVLLYVEGDNGPAVHVYESIGFTEWRSDVLYAAERAAPEPD